jgi:lysophospholipase L1-like esterase
MRTRLVRVIAGAAIAVGLVSTLEVALILVDFQHPPAERPLRITGDAVAGEIEPIHERDARELWRPRVGALVPWGRDRINAQGYRGPLLPRERTPGTLRIAALGDSTTFGYGVPYEQAWPAQLAQRLAQVGIRCEVLDAGVIGSTVRTGLERWRRLVEPCRPDVVVAAFGAVNEHSPAMGLPDDALIRKLVLEESPVVLWARRLRSDLRILHLAAWAGDRLRGRRASAEDEDLEHLDRDWRATVVGQRDWPGLRRVSPAEFEGCLRTLRAEVEASGARLVLVSMPRRIVIETDQPAVMLYTEVLERLARDEGWNVVDGRRALGVTLQGGAQVKDLFLDHFHPTPRGHELLAEAVRAALPADAVARPR